MTKLEVETVFYDQLANMDFAEVEKSSLSI
jgi:hypothetical protein